MDTAMFRRLVLDVAATMPQQLDRAGLTPCQEAARARIAARRNRLAQLWEHGAGHCGDHSMYEAYNATVESLDHDGGCGACAGLARGALLDGRLAGVKNQVLGRWPTQAPQLSETSGWRSYSAPSGHSRSRAGGT